MREELSVRLCILAFRIKKTRKVNNKDHMNGSYLGPQFSDEEVELPKSK